MPLKTMEDESVPINLTPMVDVLFNLILFFMVATKFHDLEHQLDVRLPEVAAAAPLTNPPQEIVVNVFQDGHLVVEEQAVELPALAAMLSQAREQYPEQAVLIRGDQQVVYQHIAQVLSVCKQAGIRSINLGAKLETRSVTR